jgi:hypothetical protein
MLMAATALAVGSGADFSASSANPSNTFSTGSLSMVNAKDTQAILTASAMKLGDSSRGTVDIANTGASNGSFNVSEQTDSDSGASLAPPHPLAAELNLIIQDCGLFTTTTTANDTPPACPGNNDTSTGQKYSGALNGLGNQDLGSFAGTDAQPGGDMHRYKFTVTLPANADNVFSGLATSVTFNWSAAT